MAWVRCVTEFGMGVDVHGGDATTVMVTITLESLRAELATGGLIVAASHESIGIEAKELRLG